MFSVKKLYNIKLPTQRKVKFGPVRIFLIDDSEIILVQATVSQDHPFLVLFTNQFIVPCVGPLHVNKTNFTVFGLYVQYYTFYFADRLLCIISQLSYRDQK